MKTLESEISPNASSEKTLFEKCEILQLLHSFCQEHDISYFATERLAKAAQTGQELTPDIILQPWTVAMSRSDYRRFQTQLGESGLMLKRTALDTSELTCTSNGGTSIQLQIYDRIPAQYQENHSFLEQLERSYALFAETCGTDPDKAKSLAKQLDTLMQRYCDDPSAVMLSRVLQKDAPRLNQALIYPAKNRKLNNILICVPRDCTIWTCKSSQKLAQTKLEILRALDRFCQKHKLEYFAISKLEMGCRMYGGLLPDVGNSALEVGMLRSDFNVLKHDLLCFGDSFQLYETDKFGRRDGALRVTLKSLIKGGARPGATISILPYDFLPQQEQQRKTFLAEIGQMNGRYKQALKHDGQQPEAQTEADELYREILTACIQYNHQQTGQVRYIGRIQCGQSKALPYHHVYPTVRSMVNDFEISSPRNPYIWSDNCDINYNESANADKTEILSRMNRLLSEHQITSFAIANLLIGLVTYHDFIPNHPESNWDLAFLRQDYERLLPILREQSQKYGLCFQEYRDDAGLIPKATKLVQLQELTIHDGAIRLIPFDKIPEAYDTQYAFVKKVRRLNTLFAELTKYQMSGTCALSEKEIRKAHNKYGQNPLPALYQHIEQLSQTYNDDPETHLYGRISVEKSKFIPENELFPLEQDLLRGIPVKRPHDYSTWTPVIDEALHHQVSSIQKADLLLIDKVDEICRKLDIGYFICGGSMLGYERNGGIIPWDDDIDVAMLRKDYDRFINEAGPLLDDRFFLQTRATDPHIPYLFSKIRLNNTEYITKYNEYRSFHKGICLDIFPFDFIPNDPEEQEVFRNEVLALSKAHNRIVNNQMPEPIDPVKPRGLREHYYRAYGKLKRLYFWSHSLKKTQQAYLDKATSLNSRAEELGLTTVASFVPSYTYIKLEDLLPYQDVMFNGHRVKVPKRPDIFLTMQYGDYLQLPPKHNQVAHRLLRWSVDLKADSQNTSSAVTEKGDNK